MRRGTFAEWARRSPDEDRVELARRALDEVPELLVEVVAEEVDHVRRESVRVQEAAVLDRALKSLLPQRGAGEPPTPAKILGEAGARSAVEVFRDVLAKTFAVGDGTRVTWLAATVAQHRARVTMLRAMVTGTVETIRRHEAAIALLERARKTCLGQVAA